MFKRVDRGQIVPEMRRILGNSIQMTHADGFKPRGAGILMKERPSEIKWARLNFHEETSYHEKIERTDRAEMEELLAKRVDEVTGKEAGQVYIVEKRHATIKSYPIATCIWADFEYEDHAEAICGMDWIWQDEKLRPPTYIIHNFRTLNLIWLCLKGTTRPDLDLAKRLRDKVEDIIDSYCGLPVEIYYKKRSPHTSLNPCDGILYTSGFRYNGKDIWMPPITAGSQYYEVVDRKKMDMVIKGPRGGEKKVTHELNIGQLSLFDPNAERRATS